MSITFVYLKLFTITFFPLAEGYGEWVDFHPRKDPGSTCGYLSSQLDSLGIRFQLASDSCSVFKKYICEVRKQKNTFIVIILKSNYIIFVN